MLGRIHASPLGMGNLGDNGFIHKRVGVVLISKVLIKSLAYDFPTCVVIVSLGICFYCNRL
jgi:hypothetical protein